MRCPHCGASDSRVLDSRPHSNGAEIRRRRACDRCGKRFTTVERWERKPLLVVKKDGRREPFDREKVLLGIRRACQKRPVPTDAMERMVDEVEALVRDDGGSEVESRRIGDAVMERLRAADEVAYVRFASVYRSFGDLDRFLVEVQRLRGLPSEALDR
jgi:transcriptional repressor NrdR